ncbi:MAG: protein kinase [Planctomycetota bacterium]
MNRPDESDSRTRAAEAPTPPRLGRLPSVSADHSADDETVDVIPRANQYRCVCGADVSMDKSVCPQCGRPIQWGLMDASLTAAVLTGAAETDSGTMVRQGGDAVLTGRKIGHFELRERIGSGGMGDVYRALDTSLQRFVAVKVLRRRGGSGSAVGAGSAGGLGGGAGSRGGSAIDEMLTEAVAQARLNHPNAVTIYFVGHDDDHPFLAMELLSGPTVRERLDQGPLPFDEVITLARQVVSALTQADAMGMTHSDVKPGNLLYCGPRQVKLGDFGLTHIRSSDGGGPTVVCGTPNYLAPELLDGVTPNLQSDLYALGVTLFEMTFARRPFDLVGSSLGEKLETHRHAEIEFPDRWPEDIPPAWQDVLRRLLAKDPSDRYGTYQELDVELASLKPLSAIAGGRIQRVLAFMFDQSILSISLLPALILSALVSSAFSIGETLIGMNEDDANLEMVDGLFGLLFSILAVVLGLAPILLFTWVEAKTRRTPGRYLLQMDVVDRLGYPKPRRPMVQRSFLRNAVAWAAVLELLLGTIGLGFFEPMLTIVAMLLTVISTGLLLLTPSGQTVHDLLTKTRVVLNAR